MTTWSATKVVCISLGLAACGRGRQDTDLPLRASALDANTEVHVQSRYNGHMLSVPVLVGDAIDARFIVDTGIGINLISERLCRRLHCTKHETFTGRRMSGQSVTVPLATVESIAIGQYRRRDIVVGVHDGLADTSDIDDFLSLSFFEGNAITLDDACGTLVIEDAHSLARRVTGGIAVGVAVERDGPSLTFSLPMAIGPASTARCEVDTGSNALILDEKYMKVLGVNTEHARVAAGNDETGHPFTRTFLTLEHSIHPVGAPGLI